MRIPTALRAGLLVGGTIWAGALVIAGVRMLLWRGGEAPPMTDVLLWAGVTAIIAGEFVFMALVADRVVPGMRGRLRELPQLIVGGMCMAGISWSLFLLFGGAAA